MKLYIIQNQVDINSLNELLNLYPKLNFIIVGINSTGNMFLGTIEKPDRDFIITRKRNKWFSTRVVCVDTLKQFKIERWNYSSLTSAPNFIGQIVEDTIYISDSINMIEIFKDEI